MDTTFAFGSSLVAPLRRQLRLSQADIETAGGPSVALQNDVENDRKLPGPAAATKYQDALRELRGQQIEGAALTVGDLFSAAWNAIQHEPRPFTLGLHPACDRFTLTGFDQHGNEYGPAQPRYATSIAVKRLAFSPADTDSIAELVINRTVQEATVHVALGLPTLPEAVAMAHGSRKITQLGRPDLRRQRVPSVAIDPLWQVGSLEEATRVVSHLNTRPYRDIPAWAPVCLLAAVRAARHASARIVPRTALTIGDHPSPIQFLHGHPSRLIEDIDALTSDRDVFLQGPSTDDVEKSLTFLATTFRRFHSNFLDSLISHRDDKALTLREDTVRSIHDLLPNSGDKALILTESEWDAEVLAAAIRSASNELDPPVSVVITDAQLHQAQFATTLAELDPTTETPDAQVIFCSSELTIIAAGPTLYAQHHHPLSNTP